MAGNFSGPLVVLGCGWNLWDDLKALTEMVGGEMVVDHHDSVYYNPGIDIIAVNDSALHILSDSIKHVSSRHARFLPHFAAICRLRNAIPHVYEHSIRKGAEILWDFEFGGGTSTMDAVLAGLAMGYTKVVLCGVPMDNAGHYYRPKWEASHYGTTTQANEWRWAAENIFDGRVRSMSGRTKNWMGYPTMEWLSSGRGR